MASHSRKRWFLPREYIREISQPKTLERLGGDGARWEAALQDCFPRVLLLDVVCAGLDGAVEEVLVGLVHL